MQFADEDIFDAFDEVVVSPAYEKWETVTTGINANARTTERFDQAFDTFLLMHCPHDARDGMIAYLAHFLSLKYIPMVL